MAAALMRDMQQVVGITAEHVCGLCRLDAHGITTLDATHALLPALLPLLALHARTGVHGEQAVSHFESKRLAHQCMCRFFACHHFAGSTWYSLPYRTRTVLTHPARY